MKKTLTLIAVFGTLAGPALADAYRRGKHDGPVLHADTMAIGYSGSADLVDRTIHVGIRGAAEGAMAFDVEALEIARGETIRFVLTNRSAAPHDFVTATPKEIAEHRTSMRDTPDMVHDAGYAARVAPDQTASLVWTLRTKAASPSPALFQAITRPECMVV